MTKTLWVLTDDKAGHKSQLVGLCDRLEAKLPLNIHWRSIEDERPLWRAGLQKNNPWPELPAPDWVMGAGRTTQIFTWMCRRIFGAKTIMLMNPLVPAALFDACIVPEHDRPGGGGANMLLTQGVVNTVAPVTANRQHNQGLMMVGGINKHYHWQPEELIAQVQKICASTPDVHWQLTDSRRTPESFLASSELRSIANLTLLSHVDTPPGWVKQQLESVGQVWVTSDSVSMVFEAITAYLPTGLLAMKPKKQSRVVKVMQKVSQQQLVTLFSEQALVSGLKLPVNQLWESERAANWLIERLG